MVTLRSPAGGGASDINENLATSRSAACGGAIDGNENLFTLCSAAAGGAEHDDDETEDLVTALAASFASTIVQAALVFAGFASGKHSGADSIALASSDDAEYFLKRRPMRTIIL